MKRDAADFWYNARHVHGGQALLEYVLAFAGLLTVAGIVLGFVAVAQRAAERTEALVSGECP